jgi:hypothetical protein
MPKPMLVKQPPLPLSPVPMPLFPTAGSLQEVVELGESRLPLTNKNDLVALLITYHNTLLAQLQA